MESNPTLSAVILAGPLTNALAATALTLAMSALFAKEAHARRLLALGCLAALSMPLCDLIPFYAAQIHNGALAESLVGVTVFYFIFTPGSLVLIPILLWIGSIKSVNKGVIASFPGIVINWLGMTWMHGFLLSD
jgi:hypothetical protein